MVRARILLILSTGLSLLGGSLLRGAPITYTDIAFTGATTTQAYGINNNGDVVGTYGTAGQAFLYSAGTYTDISYPAANSFTVPFGIDTNREIVGYYTISGGQEHGFLLQTNVITTIDYPGATLTEVHGVNNSTDMVGLTSVAGVSHGFYRHGLSFSLIDYPGATLTNAYGLNDSGQVVGSYQNGTGGNHGFLMLPNGNFVSLDYPGATDTIATGINNFGQISGTYTANGVPHGFILTGGSYLAVDPPSDTSSHAFKVNDSGDVVGYYDKASAPNSHTGFVSSAFTGGGYQLTLLVSPQNFGSVTASVNGNPGSPSGSYAAGTYVCLTATPAGGDVFTGYTGAQIDGAGCLTMNANATVTANFQPNPLTSASELRFVPLAPCRLVDTRGPVGPSGAPALAGNSARSFTLPGSCGIPSTALAYSLNVTAVPSGALNYLTIWPSGSNQPYVSTLNSPDGRIKANASIVPAGAGGAVSVYVTDAANVVIDINGYFDAATDASALAFYPMTPCRVSDTRLPASSLGGPTLIGGQMRIIPVLSSSCGIPPNAQAYAMNFTAIPKATLSYLTVWPTGQNQPFVSTLNALTGLTTANAAIVPAGNSGAISVFVTDNADLVVDINGYYAPISSGGLSLYALTPCRMRDTRLPSGAAPFKNTITVSATGSTCGIPPEAQAVVLNATVVPSGVLNYLTLWDNADTQPNVSTLNSLDGSEISNLGLIPTSNGLINAYNNGPANTYLILDTTGYFAP